ncbi:MAG: hypothetical protein R6U26_01025 [Candidatus Undinarchaeales archaeon]
MTPNKSKSLDELERAAEETLSPSKAPTPPAKNPRKKPPSPASIPPVSEKSSKPEMTGPRTPPSPEENQQYVTPETKTLSEKEVAELPLFMRVEKYDDIIKRLTIVVNSLNKMDDILQRLSELDKQRNEEMRNWLSHFRKTKSQVKDALKVMPETGKIEKILKTKKRSEAREGIKKEVEGLKKELGSKKGEELEEEVGELKNSLKDLKKELKNMNTEIKKVGTEAAKKSKSSKSKKSKSDKKKKSKKKKKPKSSKSSKSKYKKKEQGEPW